MLLDLEGSLGCAQAVRLQNRPHDHSIGGVQQSSDHGTRYEQQYDRSRIDGRIHGPVAGGERSFTEIPAEFHGNGLMRNRPQQCDRQEAVQDEQSRGQRVTQSKDVQNGT